MRINLTTIRAAKRGESESMAELTTLANKQAFTYIYRLTLNYHLSQDLAQETVLHLIKSLPHLEFNHANFFWSWLYRTALGKVQHHFRLQGDRRIQKNTVVNSEKVEQCMAGFDSGINAMLRDELRKAVVDAMQNLRYRYRNILALRCFEDLSYAEIASISGCSELQARLLFLRAKRSLQRQLASKGFKNDHVLPALGLFACLTAGITENAAAAISVSAASLAVLPTTTILGVLTSKTAVTIIVGIIAVSAVTNTVIEYNRYRKPPYNPTANTDSNPWPYPFAHLEYLLKSDDFSDPVEVTAFSDPDRDGFRIVEVSNPGNRKIAATPEKALVGDPNDQLRMVLSDKHWVELVFDGAIIDGPGPDLFYAGWSCRTILVVLIGAQGQRFALPVMNCLPDCPRRCSCVQIGPFDMADYKIDFKPVKVRVQGVYGRGPDRGFQLSLIRARVAKADEQQFDINQQEL